jgi:putative nucleotidyltransferase with HDIG domain
MMGLLHSLTSAVDAKDAYTCGHSERVALLARHLAQQIGLTDAEVDEVYMAGLLHDVGKIGVPESVLQKTGKLTNEEFELMKKHPQIGARILADVKQVKALIPGVLHHHERYDGRGYPDHLSGEAIPLQARVLAVADACDAMMAARPYRPALPPERIDAIMTAGAGSQWDPHIIEHFQVCRHELYSICQRGIGESVAVAVERALRAGGSNGEFTSRWGGVERVRGS